MTRFKQLERPNFFDGKLLTAADLQGEQDYAREKANLHNRFVHGWGIVSGLSVSEDQGRLVITPGLALDCAGNELVLPEPEHILLSDLSGRHYVTIEYLEVLVGQEPSPQGELQFARIREAVRVGLACTNPGAGHSGMSTGSPGCGQSHALCLATVSLHGTHWRIAPAKRAILHCK